MKDDLNIIFLLYKCNNIFKNYVVYSSYQMHNAFKNNDYLILLFAKYIKLLLE